MSSYDPTSRRFVTFPPAPSLADLLGPNLRFPKV